MINNINKIIKIVENDQKLMNMRGCIFYSDKKTFQKGKFYILGVNPGGENSETLIEDLKKLEVEKTNHYLVSWENGIKEYAKGEAPLQKRVKELFCKLNTRIENVCSSNLIFTPSVSLGYFNF